MTTRDSSRVTLQTEEYEALRKVLEEARYVDHPLVVDAIEAYDNLFRKRGS